MDKRIEIVEMRAGDINEEQMKPILEYAKTHKANPVEDRILSNK